MGTDEISTHDLLARGLQAARLLADDAMMSFLTDLRQELQAEIVNTDALDTQRREAIYFQLRGLADLEYKITAYRDTAEQIMQQGYLNNSEDD